MDIKYILNLNNKKYKITWIPGDNYNNLAPLKQSYGFCFNKKGQLLVQQKQPGNWSVMGGTIENGETPIEALKRELDEEVNIEVRNIVYLGAQKVEEEDETVYYQLRFGAIISKLKKRKIDPANGILRKRKFINPDDYVKVSGWRESGSAIIKEAKRKLNI